MSDIISRPRTVRTAELFCGEAAVDALADLADQAFATSAPVAGLLLGGFCWDEGGIYAEVTGLSPGGVDPTVAVGWFRTAEEDGCRPTVEDLQAVHRLFGNGPAYLILVDCAQSSFAVFAVERGRPRPAAFVIAEGRRSDPDCMPVAHVLFGDA